MRNTLALALGVAAAASVTAAAQPPEYGPPVPAPAPSPAPMPAVRTVVPKIPLLRVRLSGPTRRLPWTRTAALAQVVGPPIMMIRFAGGRWKLSPDRQAVQTTLILGTNSPHECFSNTCPGPIQSYLMATEGARAAVYLQQGACGATPPRPDARHRPLLLSGAAIYGSLRPYADLPPGNYTVPVRIPLAALPPGVYSLCTWLTVDPALAVSRPIPEPVIIDGQDVSAMVKYRVDVNGGRALVVLPARPRGGVRSPARPRSGPPEHDARAGP